MWVTSTDLFCNIRTTIGDAYKPISVTLEKTVSKSVEDGSVSHSLMILILVSFFKSQIKTLDGKSSCRPSMSL